MFRALSDPTRVEIVRLVSQSPRTVTELTSLVGVSQPKVSRHLKILRDAGLLEDVRRGKWVWYEVAARPERETGGTLAAAISLLFGGGAPSGAVAGSGAVAANAEAERAATGQAVPQYRGQRTAQPAASPATRSAPRRTAKKEAPPSRRAPARAPAKPPTEPSARRPAKEIEDFLL